MKTKIKEQYKTGFNSSPIHVDEKEIDFIIKNECKCNFCGQSLFEMDDFPELLIKDDELRCPQCYDEDYRPTCPICEEGYDIYDGESEYSVLIEEDANESGEKPGIYHHEELIIPIRINYFKNIEVGDHFCEVYSGEICPECVDKMTTKKDYIKFDPKLCILLRRYEGDFFNDYSPERLRHVRQDIIHRRITCRGLIE